MPSGLRGARPRVDPDGTRDSVHSSPEHLDRQPVHAGQVSQACPGNGLVLDEVTDATAAISSECNTQRADTASGRVFGSLQQRVFVFLMTLGT